VTTTKGEYTAEVVVNAAGYRAGEVMALLGQDLPIVIMSHQYLVTDDIPELKARGERLPLLRDPDVSYYLRQEGSGLILGPYEQRATPAWLEAFPKTSPSGCGTTIWIGSSPISRPRIGAYRCWPAPASSASSTDRSLLA